MIRRFSVLKTQISMYLLKQQIALVVSEIVSVRSCHALREDINGIDTRESGKKAEDTLLHCDFFEKIPSKPTEETTSTFKFSENTVKPSGLDCSTKKFIILVMFKEFNALNSSCFCKSRISERQNMNCASMKHLINDKDDVEAFNMLPAALLRVASRGKDKMSGDYYQKSSVSTCDLVFSHKDAMYRKITAEIHSWLIGASAVHDASAVDSKEVPSSFIHYKEFLHLCSCRKKALSEHVYQRGGCMVSKQENTDNNFYERIVSRGVEIVSFLNKICQGMLIRCRVWKKYILTCNTDP